MTHQWFIEDRPGSEIFVPFPPQDAGVLEQFWQAYQNDPCRHQFYFRAGPDVLRFNVTDLTLQPVPRIVTDLFDDWSEGEPHRHLLEGEPLQLQRRPAAI